MNDQLRIVAARMGLFGGAVMVSLGLVLAWAAITGLGDGGDWLYFIVLLVLGACLMGQAVGLWLEAGAGGPSRGIDRAMIGIQAIVVACLGWMATNVDRISVVNITNGELNYAGVPDEVATGIALLMLLVLYDITLRLKRRTQHATLNNPPGLTGPDS